jgi:hypothetical protein
LLTVSILINQGIVLHMHDSDYFKFLQYLYTSVLSDNTFHLELPSLRKR